MTQEEVTAQIALRTAAIAALEAIAALAATLPTADAVALAKAVHTPRGSALTLTITRGRDSRFELAIVGALGRRRVLAMCDAARDPSPTEESS